MAINGIVQYTSGFLPDILLFTQAPILVWYDRQKNIQDFFLNVSRIFQMEKRLSQ